MKNFLLVCCCLILAAIFAPMLFGILIAVLSWIVLIVAKLASLLIAIVGK